ncbi:molybdopterin-dependent oxidoreductase [[Eubacterium] cellulosolvens]
MKRYHYIAFALVIAALLVIPAATILLNENGTQTHILEATPEEVQNTTTTYQTETTPEEIQSTTITYRTDTTLTPNEGKTSTPENRELYTMVGTKRVPREAEGIFDEYNLDVSLSPKEEEQVTPLEDFFIMGSAIPDDTEKYVINPEEYTLTITGEVNNPIEFSYRRLLTEFEMKHKVTELYCTPSLRGIGKFSGPSLYDAISLSEPKDDATKVIIIASDGYRKELSLSEIESHQEDYLLAVAMNGFPLAIEHGYPIRLALISQPGLLWVKWIVEIQIV